MEAAVTRLLASVRMWIPASITLMSFSKHLTRILKHFMRAYSSGAVALRVVCVIFVHSKNIKEPRVSPTFDSLICYEDSHRTLRGLAAAIHEGSTDDPS